MSEPAREEGMRLALDHTERAARLLEVAFIIMVEENELCMRAVEQLYSTLQEAEASVTVVEARLRRNHQRGGT